MNRILIIAEHDGIEINSSTLKCVSCAKDIESANIDIVICAQDGANIAEAASKIDHINSASSVFAVMAAIGGEKLVGSANSLDPDTFWKAYID